MKLVCKTRRWKLNVMYMRWGTHASQACYLFINEIQGIVLKKWHEIHKVNANNYKWCYTHIGKHYRAHNMIYTISVKNTNNEIHIHYVH